MQQRTIEHAEVEAARKNLSVTRQELGSYYGNKTLARLVNVELTALFDHLLMEFDTLFKVSESLVSRNWKMAEGQKYPRYTRFHSDEEFIRFEHQTKRGEKIQIRKDLITGDVCFLVDGSRHWLNQPRESRGPMFLPHNAISILVTLLAEAKMLLKVINGGVVALETDASPFSTLPHQLVEPVKSDPWFAL